MTPQPDLPAEVAADAMDGIRCALLNNGESLADYATIRAHIASLERQLAEAREELRDWNNLVTAVVAPRGLPGLTVEYPKLWPFDGGQNAAMVAYALHVAIERKTTAERQLAEVTARAEGDAKRLRDLSDHFLPVMEAMRPLVLNLERLKDAASAAREG